MMTSYKASQLCGAIYNPVDPGIFDRVVSIQGITVGHAIIDGTHTFTFAGSETPKDWFRDFKAYPYEHPYLGGIHAGFWIGMEAVFEELQMELVGDISIQGHSLGAAHACIMAGLCSMHNLHVSSLYLFGCPRPGYSKLKIIIQGSVGKLLSYRNGLDPVPEVPIPFPLIEPWEHVSNLLTLNEKPEGIQELDIFDYHQMSLYQKGVMKI